MTIKTLGLTIAALLLTGSAVEAQSNNGAMATGGRTTQPIGHYELCRAVPAECQQRGVKPARQALSSKFWNTLKRVNLSVNNEFIAQTDLQTWGREELWSYPKTYADCEDFVLEKRRRLMNMGVPSGNLLITVLRQVNGEGHAVLTVRTTEGDFLLDNLETSIRLWSETNYTFLKRQSERDSGVWLTINDGRDSAVSSVQ